MLTKRKTVLVQMIKRLEERLSEKDVIITDLKKKLADLKGKKKSDVDG